MSENSDHSTQRSVFRFFFWLTVVALLLGVAATCWQLAFFKAGDPGAFVTSNVLRSILIDSAIALSGLLALALVLKWPARYFRRLLRWFFTWRILKRCLLALAVLLSLIPLFYAEENWRGKHNWENCRREWEAKGEHFDFASFIPPHVPDEENFALTPVVASCYSRVMDRNGRRIEPEDTNMVNRLKMEIFRQNLPVYTNLQLGFWQKSKLTDLKAWQDYYRTQFITNRLDGQPMANPYPRLASPEGGNPVVTNETEEIVALGTNEFPIAPQPQTPAADVLLALSKYNSAIEELRQASRLPLSRFPLNYATNNPGEIITPHHAFLKGSAMALRLRAIAELSDGQAENALADVRLILYLAGSIDNEPLTWSMSLRMALVDCAIQPIWEGLARRQWPEEQLAVLERELAGFDATSDYSRVLRSDLAWILKLLDYLRTERMANSITCMCGDTIFWPTLAYRLSPSGWFYMNKVTAAHCFQAALPTSAEQGQRILSPDIGRRFRKIETLEWSSHLPPHNWALSLIPPLEREANHCARTQTSVDLARLACALERYRRANGNYPESLNALAPAFIQKFPHDIINGQPLHYRRTRDGNFLLYSVGWNEHDDDGIPDPAGALAFFDPSGDWVWRYPAE